MFFVGDSDTQYASNEYRPRMLAEGKICFRTCFHQARIPISHLDTLTQASYSLDKEPHSVRDAIDHWLLCELLVAIGGHTIV